MKIGKKEDAHLHHMVMSMDNEEVHNETKRLELLLKKHELREKQSPWSTLATIATIISLLAGVILGFVGKSLNSEEVEKQIRVLNQTKEELTTQVDERKQKLAGLFSEESRLEARSIFLSSEISRKDGVVSSKEDIIKEKESDIDRLTKDITAKESEIREKNGDIRNLATNKSRLESEIKKLQKQHEKIKRLHQPATNK